MGYNNYLSTVDSTLDGPGDMSANLIGRNENEDGEDDWDRAWDQMKNKEGILSKKDWYELNKENKTLSEGDYDLHFDNNGNYVDKPKKKKQAAQYTRKVLIRL